MGGDQSCISASEVHPRTETAHFFRLFERASDSISKSIDFVARSVLDCLMSAAIAAYHHLQGQGKDDDYENESWFEALSPNEMALFQNLAAGQFPIETAMTIAERLDQGGISLDREALFEQHRAALSRCKSIEEAQQVSLHVFLSPPSHPLKR